MGNRVVFPLHTSTTFSVNPKDTFQYLDRLIKNAMLFFDEIILESGDYQITYGDEHCFASDLPHKDLVSYKKLRESYESVGPNKGMAQIRVKPTGAPDTEWVTVVSSPARSYYISLQGSLEQLLENYSKKELSFIKYTWVKEQRKVDDTIVKTINGIINCSPNLRVGLRELCKKWDIGIICDTQILKEAISGIFISRKMNAIPVLDELHKDVIGLLDNVRRDFQGNQLRIETLSKIMQIAVNDYSNFAIEKILSLRNEPSIIEFRKTVDEVSDELRKTNEKEVNTAIAQRINKKLMKDMGKIAPKGPKKIILYAGLDCILALPILSTWAGLGRTVITTIQDLKMHREWRNSFGCFWMKLYNENKSNN